MPRESLPRWRASARGAGTMPLGPRELNRRREALGLRNRDRLDQALVVEVRDERGHAVIAEATGVDRLGNEAMAPSVCIFIRGVIPAESPKS